MDLLIGFTIGCLFSVFLFSLLIFDEKISDDSFIKKIQGEQHEHH